MAHLPSINTQYQLIYPHDEGSSENTPSFGSSPSPSSPSTSASGKVDLMADYVTVRVQHALMLHGFIRNNTDCPTSGFLGWIKRTPQERAIECLCNPQQCS